MKGTKTMKAPVAVLYWTMEMLEKAPAFVQRIAMCLGVSCDQAE